MAEDQEHQDSIDNEEPEPVSAFYTTARNPKEVYLDKVHDEVQKVAQKWNVSLNEGQDYGVYQFQGKQSTRCGNRPIEPNTKYNNESMYRQVWRFCALKGDYESMLILGCTEPTRNVPTMRLETVEEFLRFKRKLKICCSSRQVHLDMSRISLALPSVQKVAGRHLKMNGSTVLQSATYTKPTIIVESTWIFAPTARPKQHLSSTLAAPTMPAFQG